LTPWADARPTWRAWALSEVRVSINRIPPQAAPEAEFQTAAAMARQDWGRFEQELPILPLREVEPGRYEGKMVIPDRKEPLQVEYSPSKGLRFSPRPSG
jgi:CRISPR-associated endonuclease/helicase Cas3